MTNFSFIERVKRFKLWETRSASFSSYRGSRQGLVQARTLARYTRKFNNVIVMWFITVTLLFCNIIIYFLWRVKKAVRCFKITYVIFVIIFEWRSNNICGLCYKWAFLFWITCWCLCRYSAAFINERRNVLWIA